MKSNTKLKEVKIRISRGENMNEITTSCGNCWFYSNGQCLYAGKCTASMKWNNTLNRFVPITYIENDKVDTAEALYNANWRIIGDDEIVLKKNQYEAEKEKEFLEWREEYDQNCLLRLRVSELEKQLEKSKQETREILRHMKDNIEVVDFGCGAGEYEVIDIDAEELKELAYKYGIESEEL